MLCAFEGKCDHCGHDHGNPFDRMQNFTEQAARITSLEFHNRELLAVIAAKDEALTFVHELFASETVANAIAIKPGDIALVEVGIVVENNLTHWQTMPVSAEFNSNELKINDKLYVLRKKEG